MAITRAPASLAIWIPAEPTPLPAALTRTVSPAVSRPTSISASHAVANGNLRGDRVIVGDIVRQANRIVRPNLHELGVGPPGRDPEHAGVQADVLLARDAVAASPAAQQEVRRDPVADPESGDARPDRRDLAGGIDAHDMGERLRDAKDAAADIRVAVIDADGARCG